MKCPKCDTLMIPIGYSIVYVVLGCENCSEEVEILRDTDAEKYVKQLKQMCIDNQ